MFLAGRSLRGRLVEVFGANPPPESLILDQTTKSYVDLGEKHIKIASPFIHGARNKENLSSHSALYLKSNMIL